MVKRLLLILALLVPSLASAQTVQDGFVRPPDVPAYVEVVPTYKTDAVTPNVIGDGTSTGGTAPGMADELADIPTASPEDWKVTGDFSADFPLTTLDGGSGTQAKFRTHANITHVLFDDPIRNYAQPGTSHCHMFFGNRETNAYSTFATLRNGKGSQQGSNAAGGRLNSTAYWFPCVKNGAGTHAISPRYANFYYSQAPELSEQTHPIPMGLRYVLGYNMDDQDKMKDLIAAHNTAAGYNRYRLHSSSGNSTPDYHDWTCNGVSANHLKNANDTDPFGGSCTASDELVLQVTGARCWDGVNLWSPGGYDHVLHPIWDNVTSSLVCPDGWYRIPPLAINLNFVHDGPSDYMTWTLSSDAMANGGAGVLPGASFHTDWMNGWDETTLRTWEELCVGSGVLGGVPHECNDSTISGTEKLIVGQDAPDGRDPQVNFNEITATSDPKYLYLLPASSSGPGTLHIHGD